MSHEVSNARALLRLFEQSGSRDMHVRLGTYEMFVARQDGGANPMLMAAAAEPVIALDSEVPAPTAHAEPPLTIVAPHIASLVSSLPVGSAVGPGTKVARIEVLGEHIDLEAERAGFVEAVFVEEGQLVQFDAPILRLVATA